MEVQLGTNPTPLVLLSLLSLLAVVGILFIFLKLHVHLWKRCVLSVGVLFACFGFAVVIFGVYYTVSQSFANTFRFYGYTLLAPKGDPFTLAEGDFQPVLMLREVVKKDSTVSLLSHPNPDYPTLVTLFTPGTFTEADLRDNQLSVPVGGAGALPRITKTSLWWVLTKKLTEVVTSVE